MRWRWLIPFSLCLPLWAQSYVNSYSSVITSGSTISVTFTVPSGCSPSCNATAAVFDDANFGSVHVPTFSSTGAACPSQWQPSTTYSSSAFILELGYGEGLTVAGTCTVTATFAGSIAHPALMMVSVANGLVPQFSLDTPPGSGFVSGTSFSQSVTTTGSSDYLIGFVGTNCTGSASASGWTQPNGTGNATVSSGQYTLQAFGQAAVAAGTTTMNVSMSCSGHGVGLLIAYRSTAPTSGWLGTNCTVNTSATTVSIVQPGVTAGQMAVPDLWNLMGDSAGTGLQSMADDTSDAVTASPANFRSTTGHYLYQFSSLTSGSRTFTSTSSAAAQEWHFCVSFFQGFNYIWNGMSGKTISSSQVATLSPLILPAGSYLLYASVVDTGNSPQNSYSAPSGWTQIYQGAFGSSGQVTGPIRGMWTQSVTCSPTCSISLTLTTSGGTDIDGDLFLVALSANPPSNPRITQIGNSGGVVSSSNINIQTQVPVQSGDCGILLISTNGACGFSTVPSSTVSGTGWISQMGDAGPATITAYSTASNIVTLTANNSFIPGQPVTLNFTSGPTYLNGQTLNVLSAGLSTTQFEVAWTGATGSGSAGGTAGNNSGFIDIYSNKYTASGIDLVSNGPNCNTAAQLIVTRGLACTFVPYTAKNFLDCPSGAPGSCASGSITVGQANSMVISGCHGWPGVGAIFTWSNSAYQWINDAGAHDAGTVSLVSNPLLSSGTTSNTCSNTATIPNIGASIISFAPSGAPSVTQPFLYILSKATKEAFWKEGQ